jgi:hypothetical protein
VEVISVRHVTRTVPISFIKSADEIVDAPAEAPMDQASEQESGTGGRNQQLSRLREMALV